MPLRPALPALALVLLLAAPARAAVPVVLPAKESPAAWNDALRLADLTAGSAGAGAWVEVVDRGDTWLLRVKRADGHLEEVSVAPARSAAAREELVWLSRSLLSPTTAGASWDDVPLPPTDARAATPRAGTTAPPAATASVARPPLAVTSAPPVATGPAPVSRAPRAATLAPRATPAPATSGAPAAVTSAREPVWPRAVASAPFESAATTAAPTPPVAPPVVPVALPVAATGVPALTATAATGPIPPAPGPVPAAQAAAAPVALTPAVATGPAAPAAPVRGAAAPEAAVATARPTPEAAVATARPAPEAAVATARPAPRAALAPWALAGVGAGWRIDAAMAPTLRIAGGLTRGPSFHLGAGAEWTPPRALTILTDDRSVESVELLARVGWTFSPGLSPTVTLLGGAAVRSYRQGQDPIQVAPVPVAGAEVSLEVPLQAALGLSPYVSVRTDLRPTTVSVAQVGAGTLSPAELGAGLTLTVSP